MRGATEPAQSRAQPGSLDHEPHTNPVVRPALAGFPSLAAATAAALYPGRPATLTTAVSAPRSAGSAAPTAGRRGRPLRGMNVRFRCCRA